MDQQDNGGKGDRVVTITINYDLNSGFCEVNGPMQDRVLFYGLLELARDVAQQKASPKLVSPSGEQVLRATKKVC